MECAKCEMRSSVGYCAECKALLCEICGTTCSHCGAMVCGDHIYQTKSGRELCKICMKKYEKQKKLRRAAKEAAHGE